jgi:hypothetical protein
VVPSNRICETPGCGGLGYHPPSHVKPMRRCLVCLTAEKRIRRDMVRLADDLEKMAEKPARDKTFGVRNRRHLS